MFSLLEPRGFFKSALLRARGTLLSKGNGCSSNPLDPAKPDNIFCKKELPNLSRFEDWNQSDEYFGCILRDPPSASSLPYEDSKDLIHRRGLPVGKLRDVVKIFVNHNFCYSKSSQNLPKCSCFCWYIQYIWYIYVWYIYIFIYLYLHIHIRYKYIYIYTLRDI